MSADLITQLAEYGQYLRAEQEPIGVSEIIVGDAARPSYEVDLSGRDVTGPTRRRTVVLAAAALIVLLVGGLVWLSGSDRLRDLDQHPATTTPTTTAATTTTSVPAIPEESAVREIVSKIDDDLTFGDESLTYGDHLLVAGGALWLTGVGAVVTIDTATLATRTIPIDGLPGPLLLSSGAIWVGSSGGRGAPVVSRIDIATRAITDRVEIPAPRDAYPLDLIVAGDGLWVSFSGAYVRIDLDTLTVETYRSDVGVGWVWVVEIDGYLWSYGNGLTRFELATGAIERFDVRFGGPSGAVSAGGAIWLANVDGDVGRFDTVTGQITNRLSFSHGFAYGRGAIVDDVLWYVDGGTGTITAIDTTTARVTASIVVRYGPTVLTAHDSAIWVGHTDGLVSRIDINTHEVTDVIESDGRDVRALMAIDETIWLIAADGTISRITDPR